MVLTSEDKKEMREMVFDTVSLALEEVVVPRLDRLENRIDKLETRMDRQEAETNDLRSEMRAGFAGVNKRIDDLEAKLTGRIDTIENDIRYLWYDHKTPNVLVR